ncbi:MAG: peptidylprolyl isomerase [Myxococcales bacterium]|nr:peptidylprolyl isomerase [Myxococcales bacterium]
MNRDTRTKLIAAGFGLGAVVLMIVSALDGRDEETASADASAVLATIGDEELTEAEFEAFLRFKRVSLRSDEQSERVLGELVEREALAQAIEAHGDLDTALLEAELREFRKEQLISRYFDRFLRTAVTDESIRNYYETHADEFEDRKVHVAHVLVRTNRRMTEEERQAALTKAREAYAKLQAGEPFAAVAAEYSEDRVTAQRGGDLGWVREGTISPRFSERAFALEQGGVAEPFETPFGYHVLTVLEAPQTVRRPLEAVQADIRARLRQEAKEAEVERLRGLVETEVSEEGSAPTSAQAAPSLAESAEADEQAEEG